MVESRCKLYPFNQAINDCIVIWSNSPTKKRFRIEPYQQQMPFIELPRSRIELASVLAIITSFWRIRWVGYRWEESENESFWSASFLKAFLTCFREFFSIHYRLSTISSLTLTQLSTYSFCSENWDKARREWQFWLERELDDGCQGYVKVSFRSRLFFFLRVLVRTV